MILRSTYILLLCLFAAQGSAVADLNLPEVEVSNIRRVFHNGEHNAFTDLIKFQDRYFLTFRTCPDGHMVHPTSSIIILASDDLATWQPVHQFSVRHRDTRDPHFLIFQHKLFVYTGTWYSGETTLPREQYDVNLHLGYTVYSSDGSEWSEPTMLDGTFGHYIWRAASWNGKAYICGRRKHEFHVGAYGEPRNIDALMLESDDGLIWKKKSVFRTTGGDETAFQFDANGAATAIARGYRGGPAHVLRSVPPWTTWQATKLDRNVGGPLLIHWGEHWVVGGRKTIDTACTSMYWLENDQLHEFAELPSGGDNSYPGFIALSEDRAVMSWYSSHETDAAGQTITAIYLADLAKQD